MCYHVLKVSKATNGVTTKFIWDGGNLVLEYRPDIWEYTHTYIYGADGLAYRRDDDGTIYTYNTSYRGDILSIMDENQNRMAEYVFDAYGNIFEQYNASGFSDNFGYRGEYRDPESGYIYLRMRYFDPTSGRFLTEDPAKDGLNWFSYCNGNPVKFTDPWGLKGKGEVIGQGRKYSYLDAQIIQYRLNDLGYTGSNGKALATDGIIGKNTTYAIKQFQRDQGIKVDGLVGDVTWNKLGLMLNTDITNALIDKVVNAIDENIYAYLPDNVQIPENNTDAYMLYLFYNMVKNKGPLDLKQVWKSEYFIFDGKIVRYDAPGNIAYGLAGRLLKIPEETLLLAAGAAQLKAGTSRQEWLKKI